MRMASLIGVGLAALSACAPAGPKPPGTRVEVIPADAPVIVVRHARAPAALLRVSIPARKARATLAPVGVDGTVRTWETRDHVSLSYDRGVLVATRGLGFDLMGADAGPTLAALAAGAAPGYQRQFRYLDGENHTAYLVAACTMKRTGPAETHDRLVRHVEICSGFGLAFRNIYLTDRKGEVRTAREWIGPHVGYLETER